MSFFDLTVMTFCHIIIKNNSIGDNMTKRVVIAGCRDYKNYNEAKEFIDLCISNIKDEYELIFVSGNCSGADRLGEQYAKEKGYPIELYPAEWNKYGNSAGPKRNKHMAIIGDYFICFWDGKSKGTKSIISFITELHKPLRIKRI